MIALSHKCLGRFFLFVCFFFLDIVSYLTDLSCYSGHYFDLECIVPWLQLHHTCPMCRFEVETEKMAQEEEEEEQRGWMYG